MAVIRGLKEIVMQLNVQRRRVTLIAPYPRSVATANATHELTVRGYAVTKHKSPEIWGDSGTIAYLPGLPVAKLEGFERRAKNEGKRFVPVPCEKTAWDQLFPPIVLEGNPPTDPLGEPPPKVAPGDLPAFLGAVQRCLETDDSWESVVEAVGPWWAGEKSPEALSLYVERGVEIPGRFPAFFRDFWRRYTEKKAAPPPASLREIPVIEVDVPPLPMTEMEVGELQAMVVTYQEWVAGHQEVRAGQALALEQAEEQLTQLREKVLATTQENLSLRRHVVCLQKMGEQLRLTQGTEAKRFEQELASAQVQLEAATEDLKKAREEVASVRKEVETLRAAKAAPAVEPGGLLLPAEHVRVCRDALKGGFFSAEDVLKRLLGV